VLHFSMSLVGLVMILIEIGNLSGSHSAGKPCLQFQPLLHVPGVMPT
jgi:hypothetical protein